MCFCMFLQLWDVTWKNSQEDKQDFVVQIKCPSCIKLYHKFVVKKRAGKTYNYITTDKVRCVTSLKWKLDSEN